MAAIPKVTSEEILSPGSHTLMPVKKLSDEYIINMKPPTVTGSIDPKRISKASESSLTVGSVVKAGIVFLGTVGSYYLAKTTGVFSYFGWGAKNQDVGSKGIVEIKAGINSLAVRRNLETDQISNPSLNQITQTITIQGEYIMNVEELLRSFVDGTSDLVQSTTVDGSFQFVNTAWLDTLQYTKNDVRI